MRTKRRIFIGDIQGCSTQLDRLLRKLALRSGDRVFCVGDLVNRGPDSLGVLRRLRELGAESVLGNHDIYLLKMAAGAVTIPATHPLRLVLDATDAADHLGWLEHLPILHVEEDLAVVHAGIHPMWSDLPTLAGELNRGVWAHMRTGSDARIEFATRVRYCDAQGRRPDEDDPPPVAPFLPWDHFYKGSRTIVFGHWARRGLVRGAQVRGLDSGCVYGNALTAWIAEEDRFVQAS